MIEILLVIIHSFLSFLKEEEKENCAVILLLAGFDPTPFR
jgi:hypothetical protein